MACFSRYTGLPITDPWEETKEGLSMILSTLTLERIMRLGFGLDNQGLLDSPENDIEIQQHYNKINRAISPHQENGNELGDPRFLLVRVTADRSVEGVVKFILDGIFFPNGHLGDFSTFEVKSFVA